jgi:ATP-dependent exoDNAse (exonuclease V) beta subunit
MSGLFSFVRYLDQIRKNQFDAGEASPDAAENSVQIMTIHKSKGLEFPIVIVGQAGKQFNRIDESGTAILHREYGIGMDLHDLASRRKVKSASKRFIAAHLEKETKAEEMRILYVAMTRAKKAVLLSYASTRMRNGKHESNSPSRFIREIDPRFISNPLKEKSFEDLDDDNGDFGFRKSFRGFGSGRTFPKPVSRPIPSPVRSAAKPVTKEDLRNRPLPPKIPDSEFTPVPMTELKEGQRIEHNRFGFGKILQITGSVPDLKAKIVFDSYGEKILLLKYAKIRLG